MEDLPLNSLRALAAVYLEGGLRAGARALGVAHSSVSRHLGELEEWLGVPLRTPRGGRQRLALTRTGESLAKRVAGGLNEIESAVASFREARSADSVVIGTRPSFAARWLLPRLAALERSHPHLEVSVVVEKRLDDLEAAGIDLAIRMGAGPWPGVRCEVLADDALYPVMSEGYWRRTGRPERPADLLGLRLLHDRDPHATWEVWRRNHGPAELDVRVGPRFTSTDLVLRAASLGQGVALARHRMATDDLASGLLRRPFGDLAVRLPKAYWIVLPKHAPRSRSLETMLRWLERQAAAQPGAGARLPADREQERSDEHRSFGGTRFPRRG